MKRHHREHNPGFLSSIRPWFAGKNAWVAVVGVGVIAYFWGRSKGRKEAQKQARALAIRARMQHPQGAPGPQQQGIPMMGMHGMGSIGGGFEDLGDLACDGDKACAACSKTSLPTADQQAMSGMGEDLDYM